mgnify:CR=1 FL=1
MFGAIYGDVIGSYYEVHYTKNYDFEFNKENYRQRIIELVKLNSKVTIEDAIAKGQKLLESAKG